MRKAHGQWLHYIRSRCQAGPVEAAENARMRLAQLDNIRAVVFDVYGTLFSSGVGDISLATEDNRDAALRSTLTENEIKILVDDPSKRFDERLHQVIHKHQNTRRNEGIRYPEVDIRQVWVDLLGELEQEAWIDATPDSPIETLVIDYETRVNPTQAMPGLADTLEKLRQFGPLSIISNAQFYTPMLFEAFLDADLETIGFCSKCNVWSHAELEGKPSKRLYEIAAERLDQHHGLRPENCLYVGNDMRNDIWPAQSIGFKTALFAGDRLSLRRRENHPECSQIRADLEITALSQILKCIRD